MSCLTESVQISIHLCGVDMPKQLQSGPYLSLPASMLITNQMLAAIVYFCLFTQHSLIWIWLQLDLHGVSGIKPVEMQQYKPR